jgi:hypothetical protein
MLRATNDKEADGVSATPDARVGLELTCWAVLGAGGGGKPSGPEATVQGRVDGVACAGLLVALPGAFYAAVHAAVLFQWVHIFSLVLLVAGPWTFLTTLQGGQRCSALRCPQRSAESSRMPSSPCGAGGAALPTVGFKPLDPERARGWGWHLQQMDGQTDRQRSVLRERGPRYGNLCGCGELLCGVPVEQADRACIFFGVCLFVRRSRGTGGPGVHPVKW